MRAGKVFCLLLSVLQFILFLKLIEFVRGEELQSPLTHLEKVAEENTAVNDTKSNPIDNGRGLFIAPRIKRKKLRLWNGENANLSKSDGNSKIENVPLSNSKESKGEDKIVETLFETKDEDNHPNGRLCPGCENNQCAVTDPITSGFPIIPFAIALAVGVKWFILFLILWVFYIKPEKKPQSGGYGGGYDSPSPQPGWSSSTSNTDSSFLGSFGSIFDNLNFLNSNQRSFESYSQLLTFVLDSVNTLTTLYNSN